MKAVPMTLCIPEHIMKDFHTYVPIRKRSKFICDLLSNALNIKKESIAKDFRSASNDRIRNAEIDMWDTIEGDLND